MNVFKRADNIKDLLARYDYERWIKRNLSVSYDTYNKLYLSLVELEHKYPEVITLDSPTQKPRF